MEVQDGGKWVPVPFLRVRPGRGRFGETEYDHGPTNWARVCVLPAEETADGHRSWVIRDALPKIDPAKAADIRSRLEGIRRRSDAPATSRAADTASRFADLPLGTRFAGYAQQIQQLVAQKWHTNDVDAHVQTAPVVIASFDLMRDGRIRNLRVVQQSGISALDYSAQRAILEASPFPPIPPGFERDSAKVEFKDYHDKKGKQSDKRESNNRRKMRFC
jgi:TonB family protein